jgi:hypothetical protein
VKRYRTGDVVWAPAGAGQVVAYARDSGCVRVLRSATVALLSGAGELKTLDEHAVALARPGGPNGATVRRELEALAADGFLVTIPTASAEAESVELRTIAFPTRDRPDRLARTVAGYVENAERAGRALDVVVADDSPVARTRSAYLAAIRGLSADRDVSVRYAGAGEKRACAADGPVALVSHGGPLEVIAYEDRSDALRSAPELQADVIALHEQWLGRPALGCLGHDSETADATAATLRRLRQRGGTVSVTLTGIVGDCAWDAADFLLFLPGSPGVARTREMLQAARVPTLTDRVDPMFGWCIGLDNRTLLPPFTPSGRAEDVAFGVLLSECFADRYAMHMPWVLLHEPVGPRSFALEPAFTVGFNGWLPSLLSSIDPGPGPPGERLAAVGRFVAALGGTPPAAFDDFVRMHLLDSVTIRAAALEARMPDAPKEWRRDAYRELERMRQAAVAPSEALFAGQGDRAAVQRGLRAFGEMLTAWPALWEAARTLREAGKRLSLEVEG